MKPITRLTTALLSGLLLLFGFGSCRSAKRATARSAEEAEQRRLAAQRDSIEKAQGTAPVVKPTDPGRIMILYGPPPARYRKDLDK